MSNSHSVARAVAQVADDLDSGFELAAVSATSNVTSLDDRRAVRPAPKTIAECVPLLTIAMQFIDHGPAALTIQGLELYRANALRLLRNVQPVIERHAGVAITDCADGHGTDPNPRAEKGRAAKLRSRAQAIGHVTDAFERNADALFWMTAPAATKHAAFAECVPLLAIAIELINRAPITLTIEAVEHYRAKVMWLLEHVHPAVEREARAILANWTSKLERPAAARLAA